MNSAIAAHAWCRRAESRLLRSVHHSVESGLFRVLNAVRTSCRCAGRLLFHTALVLMLPGLGTLLLIGGPARALGVYEPEVHSYLGEPLEVQVRVAQDGIAAGGALKVRVAPPAVHQSAGYAYPYDLGLEISLVEREGRTQVLITSAGPVFEPLVSFLLELYDGRGRLMREISIFLDPPPAVRPARSERRVAEEAPVLRTGSVSESTRHPGGGTSRNRYGPVESGETLSIIAARLRRPPGVDLGQMMNVLFAENPHAFGGSMDLLLEGAMLSVPFTGSDVDRVPEPVSSQSDSPSVERPRQAEAGTDAPESRFYIEKPDLGEPAAVRVVQASGAVGDAVIEVPNPKPGIRAQLHSAQARLGTLRTESRLTRETLARLEQQMAAAHDRLKRVVEGYSRLVSQVEGRIQVAASLPNPVDSQPTRMVDPAGGNGAEAPGREALVVPVYFLAAMAMVLGAVIIVLLRLMARRSTVVRQEKAQRDVPTWEQIVSGSPLDARADLKVVYSQVERGPEGELSITATGARV